MPAIELVVPKLGESISEAIVSKWLKQVGDAVATDEPVVDLETDKVSVTVNAPSAGVLIEQRAATGATVKVGEVLGVIDRDGKPSAVKEPAKAEEKRQEKRPSSRAGADNGKPTPQPSHPSPTMRKAMREGVASEASAQTTTPAQREARAAPLPAPSSNADDSVEIVPMSPLRKRIAERLVEAQHTAAILTTFNEIDMSQVMALRAKFQDAFLAKHGIKLGFMSLFARACVEALKDFPGLNAEVRGGDIVYKKHYHLGVAIGSGRGLVVPVVRHVDRMSLAEIEHAIAALAQKTKDGKLALDDLQGGTFSITNGGIYGSLLSTPLLNMPQTGILGMHNIVRRPVAVGEAIELRPMMYVALSYDHRVVDGREAVQFLVGVKERIESPERLMLGL